MILTKPPWASSLLALAVNAFPVGKMFLASGHTADFRVRAVLQFKDDLFITYEIGDIPLSERSILVAERQLYLRFGRY